MMPHNETPTEAQQDENLEQAEDPSTPSIPQTPSLISAKCSGYFVQPVCIQRSMWWMFFNLHLSVTMDGIP
jgi:hypothetical protein